MTGWDGMRGIFWEDITGSAANGRFTTYPDREKMHTCGVTKEGEGGARREATNIGDAGIQILFYF